MTTISDRDRLLRMENYPGMIPAESRVLRQYIRRHGAEHDEFRFNVRIGEGVTPSAEYGERLGRMWEQITKARPDTVAFKAPNRATIIEVKEAWLNEAVWQLTAYRDLYARAFPEHAIALVGVAQFASPTARSLAQSQGIVLHLYALPAGVIDVGEVAEEQAP